MILAVTIGSLPSNSGSKAVCIYVVLTSQNSGTTNALTSVAFTDAHNGWAVGGSGIFHTTNGGTSEDALITSYKLSFDDVKNGTIGKPASETKAELLAA